MPNGIFMDPNCGRGIYRISCTEVMKMKRRTKPTSYQAAKLLVSVEEEITAKAIIDRMVTLGRKEVPTNRSLAAKLKKDKDFIVVRPNGSQGPTVFKRIG